ncbi:MAG: hypothetical protein FWD23_06500, partial [Oscillospiraceae bacterium]|nr:hypothetical protein [Oscillospiraceae bacterium]
KFANPSDKPVALRAKLLLRKWPQLYKEHREHYPPVFKYEKRVNEVEWGFDNRKEIFEEIAVSDTFAGPGENMAVFDFDVPLIKKDECADEERYMITAESVTGANIKMAVEDRFYDFARFVTDAGNEYEAEAKCPVFAISPTPAYAEAYNLTNGINRRFSYNPVRMWQSDPSQNFPQSVTFSWNESQDITLVQIAFDSIERTYREMPFDCGKRVSDLLVRDYDIEARVNGEWVLIAAEKDNYRRFRRHTFENLRTGALRLNVKSTWNGKNARIYEVRIY